ncbi:MULTISPECIES: TIM-barrel domain-containing protein [unclassified Coleofasciculus]|uniref:TIM-barrel domain-containing protein n=1 Tax=unclassified Coleofasciculus TaxID=2692782 RepID=UPI001D145AE8|nr:MULTISPECIES: TIM-barrel domain-containing protein [unclassified Coleofasciculus]
MPLYLIYPDEPEAYQTTTEYFLGDSVLVAPVVEAGGYRRVYLPGENWWERETGKIYSGSQHLDLYVLIEQVPVFVKAGAILPLQPVSLRVGTTSRDSLILEVYAGEWGIGNRCDR